MPHRYELTREIFEDTICYILNTTKKKLGNELLNEGMSPTMNPQFYNECQKIHQINTRMIIEGKDLSDLINFLIEEPYNLDTKKVKQLPHNLTYLKTEGIDVNSEKGVENIIDMVKLK